MKGIIYRKDYKTKAEKKKLMLRFGKDYILEMIFIALECEEIELPEYKKAHPELYFYSILNSNVDVIWDYFWEDLAEA